MSVFKGLFCGSVNGSSSKENNKVKEEEELYDDSALKDFYQKVRNSRRLDDSFALEDDIDLTQSEIDEINQFWGKYKFAYPEIDYKSFKTFKNRYGKFDVRHCPGAIKTRYLNKYFVNNAYNMAYQNKGLLRRLYPSVKMPRTIIRRLNGLYYDENYNPLSYNDAIQVICDESMDGKKMIVKPSGLGGGRGIFFIEPNESLEKIKSEIKSVGINAFVIQELLIQSDFMKQFNPTSVNTLRISSLIWKGDVHILATLVRVGKVGNAVDNYSQGGILLGVNSETGQCNSWALTHDHERITSLPSGVILDQVPIVIPNFDIIRDTVRRLHFCNPYTKYISWDIALDENDMPVLIEANHAGMTQMHEAVTGPLFGDLTEEILDEYLLKRFSLQLKTKDWLCSEFHDHIVIEKYIGEDDTIYITDRIKDKDVTLIKANALPSPINKRITCSDRILKMIK